MLDGLISEPMTHRAQVLNVIQYVIGGSRAYLEVLALQQR